MHFYDFYAHSCHWLKTAYFIIKHVNTSSTTALIKDNTTLQKYSIKGKSPAGEIGENKLCKYYQQNVLRA